MPFSSSLMWSAAFGLGLLATAAFASSPNEVTTFFDYESAEVKAGQQAVILEGWARSNRIGNSRVSEKCEALIVMGFADAAEQDLINRRLEMERAEAVRGFISRKGGVPLHRIVAIGMGKKFYSVKTSSGVKEATNRVTLAHWTWNKGHWRCDPSSKSSSPPLGGPSHLFHACYLALDDGTVCNPHEVPDANPSRYSVDPYGKKIE